MATGTVTGKFVDHTGAPLECAITFTPSVKRLISATAESGPVIILPAPTTVDTIDGVFTVDLMATDDAEMTPTNWTYKVKFAFEVTTFMLDPFEIEVREGEIVNLATALVE